MSATPSEPATTVPVQVRRGAEIEVEVEKFADRGKSLARVDGYVVFIAGAVPGDRVRARVFKKKRSFAEARLLDVLRPSPLRTEPRCEYFASCGGCKWQHVEYPAQLTMKRDAVAEALAHTGGYDEDRLENMVAPTLGADAIYFYRNKMEFSFSSQRWLTDWEIASGERLDKSFALGLHVPGRFDKVLDLKTCYLQSPWSAELVNGMRAFAKERGWEAWDVRQHTGFLRHLVVRTPAHTDEKMVILVTSGEDTEGMADFAAWLQADFPEVTTLVHTINSGPAQTAYGEKTETVFGSGVIHDSLGAYTFEIAPNAFFQTNTRQAERLYEVVLSVAKLQPDDLVYDLYCGAGTIALYLSSQVTQVIGVELVEEAVANARANAAANGVDNCAFVAGDMLKLFTPSFVEEYGKPDVIVVDPPRPGMHPKVVAEIGRLRPERIVYVSCNPQTQARDLALLREHTEDAYQITAVQPVDLFPHTHHIENVVSLRVREK